MNIKGARLNVKDNKKAAELTCNFLVRVEKRGYIEHYFLSV